LGCELDSHELCSVLGFYTAKNESGHTPVVRSCEHSNETLGCKKYGEFLN